MEKVKLSFYDWSKDEFISDYEINIVDKLLPNDIFVVRILLSNGKYLNVY